MSNKLENVKPTITETRLARTVFNIANGRDPDANIESREDIIKLGKIQEQIKECNLGRDLAESVVTYLYQMGCRHYGKNLRFEASYRSDIRTLSIEHTGLYIDEQEGEKDFTISYADPTTRHVKSSLDYLAAPRNLVNGNVVLHESLQNELKQWLCHSLTLPNGREVFTIESKCIMIQFLETQEGV